MWPLAKWRVLRDNRENMEKWTVGRLLSRFQPRAPQRTVSQHAEAARRTSLPPPWRIDRRRMECRGGSERPRPMLVSQRWVVCGASELGSWVDSSLLTTVVPTRSSARDGAQRRVAQARWLWRACRGVPVAGSSWALALQLRRDAAPDADDQADPIRSDLKACDVQAGQGRLHRLWD